MPELPEVERAVVLVRSIAKGKRIHHADTTQDQLVYSGLSSHQFASETAGRTITDASRYGKYFYILLDGEGRMPVLHFGMTGTLQVRGKPSPQYKSGPSSSSDGWPPRFVKFILFIQENDGFTELAFCDARRLARIRLASSPLTEPPISDLGFDPILSMPSLTDFRDAVWTRTCPVKALLLDQSFSAGIGNYLADEILYQAQVHPEQRCNALDASQTLALHHQIADVCRITVEANADDTKYPAHWLFHHRWRKGKNVKQTMQLPSGEPATIKWITVGGRTSAYVVQVQKPLSKQKTRDETSKVLSPVILFDELEQLFLRIQAQRTQTVLGIDAPKDVAWPEIPKPEKFMIDLGVWTINISPHYYCEEVYHLKVYAVNKSRVAFKPIPVKKNLWLSPVNFFH